MKTRRYLACSVALGSLASAPLLAQETSEDDGLGIIVVTAQKRSQNLQDVPVSISVVTGDTIDKLGTPRLDTLSTSIPNLQINQDTISDRISIRGIGSGEQAGFEQSVGTFVDGVYRGRGVQSRFAFMDVASVEVLRGPQGTLFGKNTVAGALNITSAKPTDILEGSFSVDYTPRFDQLEMSGFLSAPLSDSVRTRLAFQTRNIDEGWVSNSISGDDYPDVSEWGARFTTEIDLGPNTLLSFKYEHGEWDNRGAPYEHLVAGPLAAVGVEDVRDFMIAQADINLLTGMSDPVQDFGTIQQSEGQTDEIRVSLEHEFGNGGILTAIGSYSTYDFQRAIDADISPIALVRFDDTEDQEQTTFEIRYVSDEGNILDYLLGAFYLKSDLVVDGTTPASIPTFFALTTGGCAAGNPLTDAGTAFACGTAATLQPLVGLLPGVTRFAQLNQSTETFAIFGQATWNLSDTVRLTGGLRYANEVKKASQLAYAADYAPGNTRQTANPVVTAVAQQLLEFTTHDFQGLRREENSLTWSANIQWDASDDAMFYASAATGFKAGGFNSFFTGTAAGGGALPADAEFEDEDALSFEIGAKTSIFDGIGELNIAAFYTEYNNLQVAVFSGNTTFNVSNAAAATTKGIEIDSRWQLTDDLRLTAAAAYTDFVFDSFANQACTNAQFLTFRQAQFDGALGPAAAALTAADCAAAGINNLAGRTAVDTPEFSASLLLDYSTEIGGLLAEFIGEYSFTTSVFRQGDLDPILKTGNTSLLNAGLRIGPTDGFWNLGLRVNNITNENEITSGNDIPISFGSHFGQIMPPRSVTISGTLSF
ncbi:MAG: TonB-dependent receptor [Parasphingorhabdus sp.]